MARKQQKEPAAAPVPEGPKRTRDKVCIIGCSDSKSLAPFHRRNEFEYWGVNNLFLTMPNAPWTRWFEIHHIEHKDGKWLRRGSEEFRGLQVSAYLDGLSKLPCPVYMQQSNEIVKNAVPYPLQAVLDRFGTYFTNTISWEIALAVLEGFKAIHVYGVDMAVDTEYYWQRPSCEYFLGLAKGAGIEVYIPDTCDLVKTRFLYGFNEQQELAWTNKVNSTKQIIEDKRAKALKDAQFLQKQIDQYTGALVGIEDLHKRWKNVTGG